MPPRQALVESSSAPQSLQAKQGGSQQPAHSHSTMPPPKPVGEGHQNMQSINSLEASRAGRLHGNGSRQTPAPLALSQAEPPYTNRPQSTLSSPLTPAPTTSDVHNRKSRSNSECSMCSTTSSLASPHHPSGRFPYEEIMNRYLTVNPVESSLAYAASIAIAQGVVQNGENMFARRREEEGWGVPNQRGSNSSRTLGRSEEGKN